MPHVCAGAEITNTQPLGFGAFVAGTGSVIVDPAGARTTTGTVIALATDPGQAAQFLITGDGDTTYAVTLPADGTVFLTNGDQRMPVNGFSSSPASSGVLPASGTQILNVGATLGVVDGQRPGAYSGTFTVILDYN